MSITPDSISNYQVRFPYTLAERQTYANAVKLGVDSSKNRTYAWLLQFEQAIVSQVDPKLLTDSARRSHYWSTRFFGWARSNPHDAALFTASILGLSLLARTWRRTALIAVSTLTLGTFLAMRGYAHTVELGPLLLLSTAKSSLRDAIDERHRSLSQLMKQLDNSIATGQPEEWSQLFLDLVAEITLNDPSIGKLKTTVIAASEKMLSQPESYTNVDRYQALHLIYTTLNCGSLVNQLEDGKSTFDTFPNWVDFTFQQKSMLFTRLMKRPIRYSALLNQIFPEFWEAMDPTYRVENTRQLVNNPKVFEAEIDRRRKEIFEQVPHVKILNGNSFDYVVDMLFALQPAYQKGCRIQLGLIKQHFLEVMRNKKLRSQEGAHSELIRIGNILGYDPEMLRTTLGGTNVFSSFATFLQTGKRLETRIHETVSHELVAASGELRDNGHATEVRNLPTLKKLHLTQQAIEVTPRPITEFNGKVNLLELMDHLATVDNRIPESLEDRQNNGTIKVRVKKEHLAKLRQYLQKLEGADQLNERLSSIRNILRHYTAVVRQQLKNPDADKEEVYFGLVELVAKELGFALYACEDRQLNTAMIILRTKIRSDNLEDESIPQRVQQWAAKLRDELVTNLLHGMLVEASKRDQTQYDIASSIGYWRHELRKQLGLGNVPQQAHALSRGISRDEILQRFQKIYTASWLIQKAQAEYKDKKGAPEFRFVTIREYLESVIRNYRDLEDGMVTEDWSALTDEGMAFYLQETGLIARVV